MKIGWWLRIAGSGAILAAFALGLGLLNNNVSLTARPSRAQFVGDLDRTIARSTEWALQQYGQAKTEDGATLEGRGLVSNATTAHMIVDSASLSSDPRMKMLGSGFIEAWKEKASALGKIVDPALSTNPLSSHEIQSLQEYQRWILYGASPNEFPLLSGEREHMFAADRRRTGKATHQLLALYFYRKSSGSTPELDRLMKKIEERIAWEAALDFRVTDLYLQRLAFLLAAGRPDLIKRRWVERALAAQQSDGGWLKTWHGWTRKPWRFSNRDELSSGHSTAQAMWMAHMLKYRYPQWIVENYR